MSPVPSIELPGYRPFRPPKRLDFTGWSRQEARSYFEWFTERIPERMGELRRTIERLKHDCSLDGTPDSLICLGEILLSRVSTRASTPEETAQEATELPQQLRPFVEIEEWQLTEETLSLCVDVGIYLAEVLRSTHPDLRWALWTRKTVDYNRPVLVGFQGNVPLDPIRIAINVALGKARGEHQPGDRRGRGRDR